MIVSEQSAVSSPLQDALDRRGIGFVQILVVFICGLVSLVEGADLAVLGLVAPKIAAEWSLGAGAFGPVFSSGSAGLLAGGLLFGFLADRLGRKRALAWATVIMTVGTVGTCFAASLNELLLGRLLTGVGFGGVIPASTALVTEFMPRRRKAGMICVVIVCGSIGVLVCSLISRALAGSDWRVMLWVVAAACAVVTLLTVFVLPESPSYLLLRERRDAASKLLQRLGLEIHSLDGLAPVARVAPPRTSFMGSFVALFSGYRAVGTTLIWIQMLGISSVISLMTNWLPLIMSHGGQHDSTSFGAVATHILTAILAGVLFPFVLGRWVAASHLIVFTLVGAGLSVLAIAMGTYSGNSTLLTLGLLGEGFCVSGSFYLVYAPMSEYYEMQVRSFGTGAASSFGRIGNFASPLIAAAMINAGMSVHRVFSLFSVPLLVAAGAALLFALHMRGRQAQLQTEDAKQSGRPA